MDDPEAWNAGTALLIVSVGAVFLFAVVLAVFSP